MKPFLRSTLGLIFISFMAIAGGISITGCQSGTSDFQAAAAPAVHHPTPRTDAAGQQQLASEMDQLQQNAQLAQEIVPIETRSVDKNVLRRTPVAKLTPAQSGPGLVVCEPRAIGGAAGVADFGIGCARWLQLIAAGQPELGQSPMWESIGRARNELKTPDFALTLRQASELHTIVGATDVAVGTISGSANHCVLKYQLYSVPSCKRVGPPLSLSGPEASILAGLPQIARSIDVSLDVHSPQIPKAINLTPAQMQMLGYRTWKSDTVTPHYVDPIIALVPKSPLAAISYLSSSATQYETHAEATIKTLLAQLPNNSIAWAQAARMDAIDLLPYTKQVDAHFQRYPTNYLFAATDVWLHRVDANSQAERTAAEQVIRDAPHSTDAWLTFAYTVSDEAEAVRNGRFSDMMSSKELAYIGELYPEWAYATWKACALDPQYGAAWQRLATAACFNGDDDLADKAFWRAIKLDSTDPEVYFWGLQMYQDKWDPDPAKLKKVAQIAASTNFASDNDTVKVAGDLEGVGFVEESASLMQRYMSGIQAKIAKNPNDGYAHWSLAACYLEQKRNSDAIDEYQKATQLLPNVPSLWYDLGQACDDSERTDPAIDAYQHVVRLDPDHKTAHFDLGYDLKHEGKLEQAEPELQEAVRLDPYYGDAYYGLGELYYMENKPKQAIPEYERCVELAPGTDLAYVRLSYLYETLHEPDKTIPIAYDDLLISGANIIVLDNLEDAYLQKHAYAHCINICNEILAVHADDALTQENLAEALLGNGEKAKAVDEWHTVTRSNDPHMVQVANSFLAKYQ